MQEFEVDLYEGNELVTYIVNAESPEEAEKIALQKREEVFQQETTREGLEAERAEIQRQLGEKRGRFGAALEGLRQSGASALAATGDAVTAIVQGVTDGAAALGSEKAAAASEYLQSNRNSIADWNAGIATGVYEKVAGRKLTEAEAQKAEENAARDLQVARVAADIGLTAGAGGVALRATTAPRMLAIGTAEGALSGWLLGGSSADQKEREAERFTTMSLGGALGLGAGMIPGAFAGAKNWLIRKANKALGGDALGRRAALKEAGISSPVTVGQMSGDPTWLAAEAQAAGRQADTLYREQQAQVAESLGRKIGVVIPDMANMTSGSRAIVREGIQRTGRALGKLRGVRDNEFEQGLEALQEATGGNPIIKLDGIAEVANDILSGIRENYRNVPLHENYTALLKDLDRGVSTGLTPKQANSILLRLNQMKRSGAGLFDENSSVVTGSIETYRGHAQKIAASLKEAVEAGFDRSAEKLGGEAGTALKGLRTRYAEQSQEIAVIEDELMGALGMKGDVADILRRLGKADDEAVASAMQALRKLPGGIDFQNKLLGGVYRQAVNDGSEAALGFGKKAGDFNLRAFVQSLGKNAEQSKFKGFLTPNQERNLVKGMDAIRVLLNDPRQASQTGVIKTFLPVDLQGIAINALSRDPGFMARLAAQGIQRGQGAEALFFTKEGIDLLTGAVKSVVVGQRSGQIGGTLVALLAAMTGAGAAEELGREYLEEMEQRQ